jgi:hypothetical protein
MATRKECAMKNKTFLFSLITLLSMFFILASCRKQEAKWKGTIEEVDGVTVVKNSIEPMYGEDVFDLEEELSIGEVEGKEEYMFTNIFDVAVDDEENIYILDLNQGQIRVFNPDGGFIRNISKRGQGPGEFQYPGQIMISPDREFVICDLMARRLFFFSLEGVFQRDIPTWEHGRLLSVMLDSKGEIIGEVPLRGEKQGFSLKRFSSDFAELSNISTKEREKVPILEALSPRIVWCVSEADEVIWGDSEKYEVNFQDKDGKLIKKILKEYEPVRIIAEEYSERIKRKFGGRPIPPEFEQELPKYYPAYESFTMDNDGRLFVSSFEKARSGEGHYCDVFDLEGRFIAKIHLKTHPRVWKNHKLYTIEEDEEGYQFVKRYRVTWKI